MHQSAMPPASLDQSDSCSISTECLSKSDSLHVETLKVKSFGCLSWSPQNRSALLKFIRSHNALKTVEILVSLGDVRLTPAPSRSLMFSLALLQSTKSNPNIQSVKLELDMFSLDFMQAADLLNYASSDITELKVIALFRQQISLTVVNTFLAALEPLNKEKCVAFQLVDVDKPIVIYQLDTVAIKLLSRSLERFRQPPTQLNLHVKKILPGGIRALAHFLRDFVSLKTIHLELDGKLDKGDDTTLLHSIINKKGLLHNPDHFATGLSKHTHPTTTVFLQGSDNSQLVANPSLLAQTSPYFQVLFSGRFADTDYVVNFPDSDGMHLQALMTFLRYGKDRRLDIPDVPWCSEEKRFQTMAALAHLAGYFIIPGLIPKVYMLARESLRRSPNKAFLALRTFRNQRSYSRSIPKAFEYLALKHIQYAEVHLLRAFYKDCVKIVSIKELSDGAGAAPDQVHTSLGKIAGKVEAQYKGLHFFLLQLEAHIVAGYLDPQKDLVTSVLRAGLLTSQMVQKATDQLECLNRSKICTCKKCQVRQGSVDRFLASLLECQTSGSLCAFGVLLFSFFILKAIIIYVRDWVCT